MGRWPDDWGQSIPEAIWPETLISTVAVDLRALATRRAMASVERWRGEAKDSDTERARIAKGYLFALARALTGLSSEDLEPLDPDAISLIAAAFDSEASKGPADQAATPWPNARPSTGEAPVARVSLDASSEFWPADDAILEMESSPRMPTGLFEEAEEKRSIENDFIEADEQPTRLRAPGQTFSKKPPSRAAMIDPRVGEDENPTASFALHPETGLRREPWRRSEPDELGSQDVGVPKRTVRPAQAVVRSGPSSPKDQKEVRPRATLQDVKALRALLMPIAEEVVPLAPERRSRRFWAIWREQANDRHVNRTFVERLLSEAEDQRTFLAELIAELRRFDPRSVYSLIDRIDGTSPPANAQSSGSTGVRVLGLEPREDD